MISESNEAASLAFVFSCPRVSHLRHPVGERDGGGNRVVRSVASGRGDEPEDVASVDAGRDCDRYGIVLMSSDHHHIITHQLINLSHHITSPTHLSQTRVTTPSPISIPPPPTT